MDDFEWIEKDELIEKESSDDAVQAPEPCDVAEDVSGTVHDMPTEEKEVELPSKATEDEKPLEEPPVQKVLSETLCASCSTAIEGSVTSRVLHFRQLQQPV